MARVSSPYYPPRARSYSRLLSVGSVIRRHLVLDRIRLPEGPSLGGDFVLTVRDYDERTKARVQELGAEIREVAGTSLEEAFVELVGQPGSTEVIGQ